MCLHRDGGGGVWVCTYAKRIRLSTVCAVKYVSYTSIKLLKSKNWKGEADGKAGRSKGPWVSPENTTASRYKSRKGTQT